MPWSTHIYILLALVLLYWLTVTVVKLNNNICKMHAFWVTLVAKIHFVDVKDLGKKK